MLTYNGSDLIEKSLRSVLPYCSDACVMDTGSTDNTMDILGELKKEYPQLQIRRVDVQDQGELWTGSRKDAILTALLNEITTTVSAKWILKLDDDEVFPKETMEEIVNVKGDVPFYSIPFLHFEGDHMLDPSLHRNLRVTRLFKSLVQIDWRGRYGTEVLAYNRNKISSTGRQNKLCHLTKEPFLHLGEYRRLDRKHEYRFHEKGHCGIPIPKKYLKYVS